MIWVAFSSAESNSEAVAERPSKQNVMEKTVGRVQSGRMYLFMVHSTVEVDVTLIKIAYGWRNGRSWVSALRHVGKFSVFTLTLHGMTAEWSGYSGLYKMRVIIVQAFHKCLGPRKAKGNGEPKLFPWEYLQQVLQEQRNTCYHVW